MQTNEDLKLKTRFKDFVNGINNATGKWFIVDHDDHTCMGPGFDDKDLAIQYLHKGYEDRNCYVAFGTCEQGGKFKAA